VIVTPDDIVQQLKAIAASDELAFRSADLVDSWIAAGVGLEAVAPILRFMEDHPAVDLGNPGSLVHFVERFHRTGYDGLLVASIRRKPTAHTAWMLNRLINGAEPPDLRARLVALMREARGHPLADELAVERIDFFLKDL